MHSARCWSVKQLSNEALDREYAARLQRDRVSTAELLLYLGEMEARRRYVPAGYPSMFRFCVECGGMSEDVAYKRIRAARAARRFPVIYDLLADGRITLTAVVILAPELTEHTAARLLAGAEHKTNEQVKLLLAAHAPRPDVPTTEREVSDSSAELAVRPVVPSDGSESDDSMGPLVPTPGPTPNAAPQAPQAPQAPPTPPAQQAPRAQATPLSPASMHVSTTLSMKVYEQLQEARELLSHQLPTRELSDVLEAVLSAALPVLRKQKFAETNRPRASKPKGMKPARSITNARQIPAQVKREVWDRDGGCCTFVGPTGHRCGSRDRVEFDHRIPIAKGGDSTVENVRLLCRAHNQYEAERLLGEGFMRGKRAWAAAAASHRAGAEGAAAPSRAAP